MTGAACSAISTVAVHRRNPRLVTPGERRPPQTLASRPTARSSCAVRAHETRNPSPTLGGGEPRALRSSTFRTPARPLPAAGPSLPTIAFRGSSQPHRARCGWRSLLSLPPPNPSLPHHQPSLAQVSRRSPKAAAAMQPPTKGAGPCRRRPRASRLAGCGRHRRSQERPPACWRCPVCPCGAGSGSRGRQEQEGPG